MNLNKWSLGAMLALTMVVSAAPAARAATVFGDNFESDALGLNVGLNNWIVSSGTIDVVGSGFFDGLCNPASGSSPTPNHCVDTDGSTSDAGTMSTAALNLTPGGYTLSFWAAGNQRYGDTNELQFSIGPLLQTLTLPGNAPWQQYTYNFNIGAPTSSPLVFGEIGGPGIDVNNNVGILLDNVSLDQVSAPVPEPMSLTLFGSGLIGLIVRRRQMAAK